MTFQVWINETGRNWERYSREDHATRDLALVEAREASEDGEVRVGITENHEIGGIEELSRRELASLPAAINAYLIGETSAGMLAIQIYEDDALVYSHDYFAKGASEAQYREVIETQAWEDMVNASEWRLYDGCDIDDDGDVVDYDIEETTLKTVQYCPSTNTWTYLASDKMSDDFIAANAYRLPASIVAD